MWRKPDGSQCRACVMLQVLAPLCSAVRAAISVGSQRTRPGLLTLLQQCSLPVAPASHIKAQKHAFTCSLLVFVTSSLDCKALSRLAQRECTSPDVL